MTFCFIVRLINTLTYLLIGQLGARKRRMLAVAWLVFTLHQLWQWCHHYVFLSICCNTTGFPMNWSNTILTRVISCNLRIGRSPFDRRNLVFSLTTLFVALPASSRVYNKRTELWINSAELHWRTHPTTHIKFNLHQCQMNATIVYCT